MRTVVNIHEAKTHLSRLIEQVVAGESVTIARAGTPVVDLVPHVPVTVVLGTCRNQLDYDDATFDEPDRDFLAMFEQA